MDVLLFSEYGYTLVHHYQVLGRGAVHATLRGPFMAKLRSIAVRAEAEHKWEDGHRPIRKAPVAATSDTLRGARPRDQDVESPLCKSRRAASPIMLEVSSRKKPSLTVSSKMLSSGTAPSDTPGTDAPPLIHTLLYGGRPPLAPVSLRIPRFADKDFIPSKIQSVLVATMPYPSSPESPASTACLDLDAFVSEESGLSKGRSRTSMVERDRESVSSGTSGADEQSDMSCELSRFRPVNIPVSPIPDNDSQDVVESPSHYEAPDVPVAASALLDTVVYIF